MNKRLALALSFIAFASAGLATSASAQEKTRAEVRQELIQAENNGSRYVTDTSYPAVNPIFEQQVARLKASAGGVGAETGATSAAGPAGKPMSTMPTHACVGPAGFCTLYFGS
jgi:hypothetical protein